MDLNGSQNDVPFKHFYDVAQIWKLRVNFVKLDHLLDIQFPKNLRKIFGKTFTKICC